MGHSPKRFCPTESFYGYEPSDVIKVGGPTGKRGLPGVVAKGDIGLNGLSAYQVAVQAGVFVGTELEWLESLKSEPGVGDNESFDINLALLYNISKI